MSYIVLVFCALSWGFKKFPFQPARVPFPTSVVSLFGLFSVFSLALLLWQTGVGSFLFYNSTTHTQEPVTDLVSTKRVARIAPQTVKVFVNLRKPDIALLCDQMKVLRSRGSVFSSKGMLCSGPRYTAENMWQVFCLRVCHRKEFLTSRIVHLMLLIELQATE